MAAAGSEQKIPLGGIVDPDPLLPLRLMNGEEWAAKVATVSVLPWPKVKGANV